MATTDDVFNLLKAINEITLKRMEDQELLMRSLSNGWRVKTLRY